jgi:hypothetical protein
MAASMGIAGVMCGLILLTAAVFFFTIFSPIGKWMERRKWRRELATHGRECLFCGGTRTKLVPHPESGRYICKDQGLCQAARHFRNLLDSTP